MSQRQRREREANDRTSKWRLAWLVVAGVVGVAIAVVLLGVALVLHTTPPPAIHTDPAAAKRLQEEIEKARTLVPGGTQEVVEADETELNSWLEEYLQPGRTMQTATNAAVIRDMKLNLTDDQMRLYVLANLRGKNLSFVLEGKLRTVDGFLDFEPIKGKIGALPIPNASLRKAMTELLATPESRQSLRLPSNLRDLHIENGKLVVVFR